MKKLLKALGVAALIGSIPYAATQDKETGDFKLHALLWNLKVSTNEEGEKHIDVKIGFSNPFEHECCCGGECHCHDEAEEESCCEAEEESCCCEEETAAEPCCPEQAEGTCCCEETPVENN